MRSFFLVFVFLTLGCFHPLMAYDCSAFLESTTVRAQAVAVATSENTEKLWTDFEQNNPLTEALTNSGFERDFQNPLLWRRARDRAFLKIATEQERAEILKNESLLSVTNGITSHVLSPEGEVEVHITLLNFPWEVMRIGKRLSGSSAQKFLDSVKKNGIHRESIETFQHELVHLEQIETPYGRHILNARRRFNIANQKFKIPGASREDQSEYYAAQQAMISSSIDAARWVEEIEAHSIHDPRMSEIWKALKTPEVSDEEMIELLRRSKLILQSSYYDINMEGGAYREAIRWIRMGIFVR